MKQSRFSYILIRALSSILIAIVAYFIFIPINTWLELDLSVAGFIYFVSAALAGILAGMVMYSQPAGALKKYLPAVAGILLCLLMSILLGTRSGLVSMLVLCCALLGAWFFAVRSASLKLDDAINMSRFYFSIPLLLFVNLSVWVSPTSKALIPSVSMYSVVYIGISLFLMVRIRNEVLYQKDSGKRQNVFDLGITGFFLLLTFVLASPEILHIILIPVKWVYGLLVDVFLLIMTPFAYYILPALIGFFSRDVPSSYFQNTPRQADGSKPQDLANPASVMIAEWVVNIVTIVALTAILIFIIVRIIRYIRDLKIRNEEFDFTEEKEFVSDIRHDWFQGIRKAGNSLKGIVKQTGLHLHTSNREKIRHEYGAFLTVLASTGKLGGNYTSRRIMHTLVEKYPDIKKDMGAVTECYEGVRYGIAEPDGQEVKEFREAVSRIILSIK